MPISDYLRHLRTQIGHEMVFVPGVVGIVFDEAGRVLLQHSKDGGWWMPGGSVDPGEEPAESVIREVWEETGVQVVPEQIVVVQTEPTFQYPNGDQVMYLSIVFRCRPVGGEAHVHDEESLEVDYFLPGALPDLHPRARLWLEQALKHESRTYFRISRSEQDRIA